MVLIWLQLMACMAHSPIHLQHSASTDFSIALTAENIQKDESILLPDAISSAIAKRLDKHLINGIVLNELPKGYSKVTSSQKRAEMIPGPNRLTIDFKTEYYSQIAGRFRWVVHATILLQESEQTTVEHITIPVFHKFGHLQDVASIESALPNVLDEVSLMVNEHINGSKK